MKHQICEYKNEVKSSKSWQREICPQIQHRRVTNITHGYEHHATKLDLQMQSVRGSNNARPWNCFCGKDLRCITKLAVHSQKIYPRICIVNSYCGCAIFSNLQTVHTSFLDTFSDQITAALPKKSDDFKKHLFEISRATSYISKEQLFVILKYKLYQLGKLLDTHPFYKQGLYQFI